MPDRRDPHAPPLKPVVFHILLVLLDGERHGYAIVKEVEARTRHQLRIEPANLYRTLRGMMADGFVTETPRLADPETGDQRRRYFAITEAGIEAARVETARMDALLVLARSHDLLAAPKVR